MSYLRSLQPHAAVEYGKVRRVVALKRGVGDHTPERFADHELGSCYRGLGQIRPALVRRLTYVDLMTIICWDNCSEASIT